MNYWSIYKNDQILIEGSEAWQLAQKYPNAGSHDGTNTVFVEALDNPTNAFILPSVDEAGEPLSADQQALLAAQWLYSESARGMLLTQSQAEMLYTHPTHRLWCANYEYRPEQFEPDYHYVGALVTALFPHVQWPAFTSELTPTQARAIMLQGLGG